LKDDDYLRHQDRSHQLLVSDAVGEAPLHHEEDQEMVQEVVQEVREDQEDQEVVRVVLSSPDELSSFSLFSDSSDVCGHF